MDEQTRQNALQILRSAAVSAGASQEDAELLAEFMVNNHDKTDAGE